MSAASYAELLPALQDEIRSVLADVAEAEIQALEDAIDRAPRVFCAGRGRSGLAVRGFAMRLMHLGATSYVVGDTTTPSIGAGDLLLLASGTATTATLLPIAEKAAAAGARRATVTANPEGVLARDADLRVRVPAPPSHDDPGQPGAQLLAMGSRFEIATSLLFEALTVRLMRRRGVAVAEMFARHANLE